MIKLRSTGFSNVEIFVKLEGRNMGGSIKDRAAAYVLENELLSRKINKKTTIIESSSGNFGISLALFSNKSACNGWVSINMG